jgi:hypothetical protein
MGRAEGSVTFFPHPSLPVTENFVSTSNGHISRTSTVSYCGIFSNVGFLSAVPQKLTPSSTISSHLTKAFYVSFRSLNVYERFNKLSEIDSPIRLSSAITQQIGWRTALADVTVDDHVKIMQCSGNFCLTEEILGTRERIEVISVQFCKGSNELEVIWSPVLQWQQVSCSNSIQHALTLLFASS